MDILTQEEIDKLINSANDPDSLESLKQEENAKKIKVYDFKRPDKFSKDQIRTLYMLHESFARLLNTYMSSHLRTLVNVGGPRSGKYLKASIIAEFNPGKKSVINEETHALQPDAEVKVNDVATQFLRATSLEDFDADKQDEFKKQLKDALNAALGGGSVYDVYITSFLLQ